MSNLTATALILALTTTTYTIAMWVSVRTNERGDEILYGVAKGIPMSAKDRRLMLFTDWLPYSVFLIAFLLIMAIGNIQLATSADDPRVGLLANMCAGFLAMGGVFWLLLGSFVFVNMLSVLRRSTRD